MSHEEDLDDLLDGEEGEETEAKERERGGNASSCCSWSDALFCFVLFFFAFLTHDTDALEDFQQLKGKAEATEAKATKDR